MGKRHLGSKRRRVLSLVVFTTRRLLRHQSLAADGEEKDDPAPGYNEFVGR